MKYTIGLDYGTLSGRGILVRCRDGEIIASAVKEYSHGVMTSQLPDSKETLPSSWCLEHPQDYIDVLDYVIPKLLTDSQVPKEDIIGIGIDFTACTLLPIDKNATPLCFKPEFKHRRNAYVKLWKHHGAQKQANKINLLLEQKNLAADARFGGKISSELLLPKVMEILEEDVEIYHAADEILEAGDWLTRLLTGSHGRSCSMAGYKAWWNQTDGYPDNDFYKELHIGLNGFVKEKLPGKVYNMGEPVGFLTPEWAQRLGLSEGMAVSPTIIDSHSGVPGSCVSNMQQAMLVLGTSSVIVAFNDKPYSGDGILGGVKDAIIPGYYALESGLASVGDLFNWFVKNSVPESYWTEARNEGISIHTLLSRKAEHLEPGSNGLIALEWWNGNKTPFVDGNLKGTILGMTLNTKPEEIYRALIEATAFGTKRILDLYESNGVKINEMIASGGISTKNPLLMQIYADVLNYKLKVAASDQAAALGAAIYAALSAGKTHGGYDDYETAVQSMSKLEDTVYYPNEKNNKKYMKIYSSYCKISDIIGTEVKNYFINIP